MQSGLLAGARRVLHVGSPRYWRWRRFLAGLPLDPDELPRPVERPSDRDFIICGSPRSGTTLVAAMLHQPPACVTVMEPWDGMRHPPADLFRSLREEIDQRGRLSRGKLDIDALASDGEVRWRSEGRSTTPVTTVENYVLGVKWPAFWRYLELLPATRFIVCVRHPVEVIASFKRVGGRLGQGLEYDTAFNRRMNAELRSTRNLALRRVRLYDYIHSRILPHLNRSNVLTVRYEQWFSDPGRVLGEIGDFLGADLGTSRAAIRPREAQPSLDEGELELIRQECQTASPLGYAL
jgi:Sulfotransferase family